jgi:hypothetical protein
VALPLAVTENAPFRLPYGWVGNVGNVARTELGVSSSPGPAVLQARAAIQPDRMTTFHLNTPPIMRHVCRGRVEEVNVKREANEIQATTADRIRSATDFGSGA